MAIKTFTTGEVLTAADTNTYLANSGLVYITATTFTTSTSVEVDNVFSSTYDNYKILITAYSATGTPSVYLQYRVGGTNATGTDYYTKGWYNFGTLTGYAPAAAAFWYLGDCSNNIQYPGYFTAEIQAPNKTQRTAGFSTCVESFSTNVINFNNTHATGNAYTGFRIYPTASNISGNVRVYGYRQA
jgi:hypothetical protein